MSSKVLQRSFAGGEVSSEMWGRIDDGKYQTGLARCRNFIPLPQGPVVNRPGTEFVRECGASDCAVILVPFVFSNKDTMVLEVGDKYIRFHTNGKTLCKDDGDVYQISAPWSYKDLYELSFQQSNDVLTVCHPLYQPREIRRYSALDWRIVAVSFSSPLSAPGGVTATRATSAASDSNAEKYTQEYKVTALNSDKTQESQASAKASVVANLYATGTTVKISWNAVSGASFYRVYKNVGGIYGYIGDTSDLSIIDGGIKAEAGTTPPRFEDIFNSAKGITSVSVSAQGSGYVFYDNGIKASAGTLKFKGTAGGVSFSGNRLVCSRSDERPSYSEGAIPEEEKHFPAPATISLTVTDESGPGSGAAITPVYKIERSAYRSQQSTGNPDDPWQDTVVSETTVTLVNYTVTNPGSGYVKPVIKYTHPETYDPGNVWRPEGVTVKKAKVAVTASAYPGTESTGMTLRVTDSTGSGASLKPLVTGGKLVGVTIVSGGSGYTSPVVTVVSTAGSGAKVTASVGSVGDFPGCSAYHEQRRVFAGTAVHPQQIWMTRSSTESDMSYHLPSKDDDRINFRVASGESSRIIHMASLSGGLVLLTGAGEWRVTSVNSDAITPSSVSVKPQAYNGSGTAQPMVVNSVLLYAAARGGHVRELSYQYQASGFVSGDCCLRAAHLFDRLTIKQMAFAKAPWPLCYFVSSDGSLLTMTYVPEQQVGAWAKHTTVNGVYESVAVVPEADEDGVYVVVNRVVNGQHKRYIERFHSRDFSDQTEAFFVDCGATWHGSGSKTISGLSFLEGQTVAILADGAVVPEQVVTGGKITLPVPASTVVVGLPITSEIQTLPMIMQDESYGQGHKKNVSAVHARVYRSSGISAGPDAGHLTEYKQRKTEQPGFAPELATDEISVEVSPAWTDNGQIVIRQTDPLPVEVLSITAEVVS